MAIKNRHVPLASGQRKKVTVRCPSCGWRGGRVYDGDSPGGFGYCRPCFVNNGLLAEVRPVPTRAEARQKKAERELKGGGR